MHAGPEISEGLDLEARRAKDIIQRGLSVLPQRLQEAGSPKAEVDAYVSGQPM